jgi:hypothetical protein
MKRIKRPTFIIFVCIVPIAVVVLGFAVHNALTAEQKLRQAAEKAYTHQFAGINTVLDKYGFKTAPARRSCNNVEGDQPVYKICYYHVDSEVVLDEKLQTTWPAAVTALTKQFNQNQWVKQPNHDPVTKNPVDSLSRLLEYSGKYAADVSYEKTTGNTTCWARFDVVPAKPASIRLSELCYSVDRHWY